LTHSNANVERYKFLTPLLISGFFFFSAFYLCILKVSIFIYMLPLFALFLLISLYLFYKTDKEIVQLIKEGHPNLNLYRFYHNCIGIYVVLFIVLFGISVTYIPFYHHGGSIFVWYCTPMTLLCLISLIQSKKRMNKLSNNMPNNTNDFNT
jgi:hypothetical protein